jgi:chaperone modulatory protein CbpM
METVQWISLSDICHSHGVQLTLVETFHAAGLIEITEADNKKWLPEIQLPKLEQMIRLHDEMDINPAGIETIHHLLERMERMQEQIMQLTNQLRFYKEE